MLFLKSIQKYAIALLFFITISAGVIYAQEPKGDQKTAQLSSIKNMVEATNYVFVPQSVLPVSGRTRQLTSYYDLRIFKDTIISYLPYFGRAYTAPINPEDGCINFTSTDFEYTTALRKKGGWSIVVKFKDQSQVREMNLTIFDNGRADLFVTSNNRQSISFSGNIRERK